MFSKYYQSELTYLRDLGRLFAQSNPAIAGLLGERGSDPDVERLLEGFAFLTARIRERIDDNVPEIIHALCDLVAPHYLRPIPACSIVEFSPELGSLRGRYRVAAGTMLAAAPLHQTTCQFRTSTDFDLLPLLLDSAQLDETSSTTPVLRVGFECDDKALPAVLDPQGLRLFIAEDHAMSGMLMLWLLRYCRRVEVRALGDGSAKTIATLPPSVISAPGFRADSALLPWPKSSRTGLRLLQEYFTLPAKFFFIDVTGLDAAKDLSSKRFELAFHCERPPRLPAPIGRQTFRLHCVPVVNLFKTSANPIPATPIQHEHLLRAADSNWAHMELFSVESVVGIGSGGQRTYRPFFGFAHAQPNPAEPYYVLRRAPSPIDGELDGYLGLFTPGNTARGEEVLSVEALWTNRLLAGELRAGQISQPTTSSPPFATFKNIVEVSKPVRPPLDGELHWRLIAHLALNTASIADPQKLRSLLEVYNFQGLASQAVGRANQRRTESVHEVQTNPARRLLRGMAVRGVQTQVHVHEDHFAGEGDAFLFGCILDALFAELVGINTFNETVLKLLPSQTEYRWQPRAGNVAL